MEIFMHNLPVYIQDLELKICIAQHLHGPNFDHLQTNFAVHLNRTKQHARSRTGTFTLADVAVGHKFLQLYESAFIPIGNNRVYFKRSQNAPRQDIVESVSRLPWVNPVEEQQQRTREANLTAKSARLISVQFGWSCRDVVFSIENEATRESQLRFDPQRRELHIVMMEDSFEYTIAIRQSSIDSSYVYNAPGGRSILYLDLSMPPLFLSKIQNASPAGKKRYIRLSSVPLFSNPQAAPFTCLALRVMFSSSSDSDTFLQLANEARLRNIQKYQVVAEGRGLFSVAQLDLVQRQLRRFNWCVAYQLAALLQNMIVDATELLELMPRVRRLVAAKGKEYTAKFLKRFSTKASILLYKEDSGDLSTCFNATEQEFTNQDDTLSLVPDDGSYYQSLHVTITPTSMFFYGPHPEQSNRVIRRYETKHQESFLRVSFRDENDMQYRVDRDIDGAAFIKDRFGTFLKEGLIIASRKFEFLAYSQSALKDHSVWFVKPFNDAVHGLITARKIIESLGSFDNLSYDPTLMRCPARYAARISQAFTATDAAVVPVEEILHIADINTADGKYCFTDGVGTMSNELARAIWEKLRETRRKGKRADFPHAYQIRYQGSKGMLSIDYKLNGSHAIGLRPSMTKFDSPAGDQHSIEIARAFDRPTTYYLNRPLIMLLEGLGVRYEVFKDFQDQAVYQTKSATSTLKAAARLLETHGLGTSFRLSATMNNLDKLGLDSLPDDKFYSQFLKFAVHHILRDLKHHARIPIPDAWTLVGVADVHHYLAEDQVFACVKQPNHRAIYIEGPVLVSRSPTIHPGDVQMAYAIGMPPENSCFNKEALPNTIVFSVKGKRPLSTSLGGGDLDGDIYNIIPLNDHPWFQPTKPIFDPAEYPPTQRKLLDRPSTIEDVADFVMEYIISDVVGIIAINWLIIADQSPEGIEDQDCLTLAALHSDAVDYPKSGRPVDPERIPRLKFRARPDWNAPETINPLESGVHYQSQRVIGKLFRDIDLDELPTASRSRRRRGRVQQQRGIDALVNELSSFSLHGTDSIVFQLVSRSVGKYLDTAGPWEKEDKDHVARLFRNYCTELTSTATSYSISHRNLLLAEEELIIGTITQKTSQPRVRKENMRKVREQTDILVRGIRQELEGDDEKTYEDYLKHCWLAWELSLVETRRNTFGAQSFSWLSLGAIFDALKQVEDQDAAEIRSTLNRGRR